MSTDHRTSRSSAVAQFRENRIERRAADIEERTSMILRVADDVAELVQNARYDLESTRSKRAAMSRDLHGALDGFRKDLADGMSRTLSEMRSARAQQASDDRAARHGFLSDLRADVVRIVTRDFRVA